MRQSNTAPEQGILPVLNMKWDEQDQKIKWYRIRVYWFTLVELIVVIAILSILGTIAFLSLGNYSSKARDSARISDVWQISKSIDIAKVTSGGPYPLPDNAYALTYSGSAVWHQGTVGPLVMQYLKSIIPGGGMNAQPVDPLDKTEYTYSRLAYGNSYQIKAECENDVTNPTAFKQADNSLIQTASAQSGDTKFVYIRGNYWWLIAKTLTGSIYYVLAMPSIITNSGTTTGNSLSIEDNALSGTLLFNGKAPTNATTYDPADKVVFSGTTLPSSDASGQITSMVTALKSAYATVPDIAGNTAIANLLATTGTSSIQSFGASLITTQLGWTATAWGGGGGGGGAEGSTTCDSLAPWASCWWNTIYAFTLGGDHFITTPGNCTDSANPTCDGSDDTVTKPWNDGAAMDTETFVLSLTDGFNNTLALAGMDANASDGGIQDHMAAKYCDAMNYWGKEDWFLPAQDQLHELLVNAPAITGFASGNYWSSTESDMYSGAFDLGWGDYKTNPHFVRCIRKY